MKGVVSGIFKERPVMAAESKTLRGRIVNQPEGVKGIWILFFH